MSAFKVTVFYVATVLGALVFQLLLPDSEGDLLVISGSNAKASMSGGLDSDQHIYALLAETNAHLITKLDDTGFVVRSALVNGRRSNSETIKKLYDNGAFLIVNASGLRGCSGAEGTFKKWSYLS